MQRQQAPPPQDEARSFAESLSEEDLDYLKQVARKTCARVASASRMDSSGSVHWEPIGHKDGVDIYIGEAEASDRKAKSSSSYRKYLCGVTHIPATLDDIVHLFHSKTDLQRSKNDGSKKSFNAFERDILNTKTLYKIRKRTSNAPRHCISLKWMRLGSTINDIEDRDFVFLECQDTIFDEKVKRRGWVCSMHSVQLPGCPPLAGYVRGSLYRSGYVFRETETPNVLQVVCIMDMDFKGTMNSNVSNLVLKSRVMIVGAIQTHFKELEEENQPEEPNDATPCPLCEDFLASTPCASCGQIVCMNCSQPFGEENSVCTICIMHGKVDEMLAEQENDTDEEDASILLPARNGPSPKNVIIKTLPQVDEDQTLSSNSTLSDNQVEETTPAISLREPGFFSSMWACSASAPESVTTSDSVSYVEPDGSDAMYSLAVQRLQLAMSADQEATRLDIVNLYYQNSDDISLKFDFEMAFGFTMTKVTKIPSKPKCTELNGIQIQQLKAIAHMTCIDLVYASRLSPDCKHGIVWTPIPSQDKTLQFYSGKQKNNLITHDMRFMCCVTKIRASLSDVIDVLNGSKGATLSADIKTHLDNDVLVKTTLKTLKNVDRLKMRLKWIVLNSASPYIPMRDYVYLEYQNDIRVMGHAGWACNMHSVALPDFPSYEASNNIIRGSFYRTGYVVTETHTPGVLRVVHMMQVDFKGSGVPYQTADMMMTTRVGNIGYLNEYFRKIALIDRILPVSPSQKTQRVTKLCFHCLKKFGIMTKKHTCRLCGDVICASCSHTKAFDMNIPELKDIRVCSVCSASENEDVMRSILTEVLMRPSSSVESDNHILGKVPKYVSNRDSDILGDSPAESYLHGNADRKQSHGQSLASSVILEDEEVEIEPLPLPRIPYLEKKQKQLSTNGPTLTKNWLGQEIYESNSVESTHSLGSSVLRAPRGEGPGMDWLDPLDSFRSSVASGSNSLTSLSLASSGHSLDELIHEL